MRRFELTAGTSSKFWEITLEEAVVTVRFGRIGTTGQTQARTWPDAATARREHDRLVREKTGKGYAEVQGAATAAAADAGPAGAAAAADASTVAAADACAAAAADACTAAAAQPALAAIPSPGPAPAPAAAPVPVAAAAAAAIEWPEGGFQWDDALLEELPVVRGVRVPPAVDGHALAQRPLVLEDDTHRFARHHLDALAAALGRRFEPWGRAECERIITPQRLAQPDPAWWQELLVQAACGQAGAGASPYGQGYGAGVAWAAYAGAALQGLPFMLERTLDLARACGGAAQPLQHLGWQLRGLPQALRHVIAGAPQPEHDAAIALLEAQAGSTREDRLLRAHLCPHREDWVLQCLADGPVDEMGWLGHCVMPADQALRYFQARSPASYTLRQPVLLQVRLHGPAAMHLLAHALSIASGKRELEQWLALAERMHDPRMPALLAGSLELQEVRDTLERWARRWPAAVLKCAIEQAMASGSRLQEGWTVRLALREPAALAAVRPALPEDTRNRFDALLGALNLQEATPEALPPVLRQPPWLGQARAAELPVLDIAARPVPDRVEFPPDEQARLQALQASGWVARRMAQTAEALAEELQLTRGAVARVLGGEPLREGDIQVTKRWFHGAPIDALLAVPGPASLALWNSYPAKYWYTWGQDPSTVPAMLARHGAAALPGLVAWAEADAEAGLAVALPVDSARLVPVAMHALRNLKKARSPAMAWLRAHAATALTTALPVAFTRAGSVRDDARHAVRWLVASGYADDARRIAADHGEPLARALQALLDADPLLVLPSRMPKLPAFFVAASFRRPVLRAGGAALPLAAVEHVGTMLAISKLEAPYAGLALVRQACTPESLAEFAWDVYEAWAAAGHPSKENWAFAGLGLLGTDETARRLAPKIREWPGEGGHQRAVAGLDLLAAIGSDVALMHLNGIAAKVKFKALQDRAREKIAAVAEARGLSAAELADRLVPDLGLDEQGTLVLDFGPRRFFVAFDETLRPLVRDAQGARLKDLPKPLKSDDAALAEAATERYKQVKRDAKAVSSLQVTRLEMAMVDRRRWPAADFRLFFLQHPLMRHLAARVVWGVYGADGTLTGAFRVAEDLTLADAQDEAWTLPDDATVGIAHVLEMPAALRDGFGQVFADYEILQPFRQLGREVHALTEAELRSTQVVRHADKVVATGSVMGLVNRGWERGPAQDGGWVGWFSKRLGDGLQVDLQLDPGMSVGDLAMEPRQRLPALVLRTAGSWDQDGQVAFGRLHPIVASEVLRDIALLAPAPPA